MEALGRRGFVSLVFLMPSYILLYVTVRCGMLQWHSTGRGKGEEGGGREEEEEECALLLGKER